MIPIIAATTAAAPMPIPTLAAVERPSASCVEAFVPFSDAAPAVGLAVSEEEELVVVEGAKVGFVAPKNVVLAVLDDKLYMPCQQPIACYPWLGSLC